MMRWDRIDSELAVAPLFFKNQLILHPLKYHIKIFLLSQAKELRHLIKKKSAYKSLAYAGLYHIELQQCYNTSGKHQVLTQPHSSPLCFTLLCFSKKSSGN
jgi:hypothetical protein